MGRAEQARQWRVTELSFTAEREYADPFDYTTTRLVAAFEGPGGQSVEVPGFWDGGRQWRVRFTPTAPGRWTWRTRFSHADAGLAGQAGELSAEPPADDAHALHRHGGLLRVSDDGRYLTHTDGTPFFYLADTWWAGPGPKVTVEVFRACVEARLAQGYTAFQAHGHRGLTEEGPGAFESVQAASPEALDYWRGVDAYYAYADARGLLGVTGFFGAWSMRDYDDENHRRLWHYYLARCGAYPITFLVTQEYNQKVGPNKDADFDDRYMALAAFIKDHDPYNRAMTIHPWAFTVENRKAWDEPWCDFRMVQAGHWGYRQPDDYYGVYFRQPTRPLLESEANYEGFRKDDFSADAACIRRVAYMAIQCGSFGFGYGAQGLYGGVVDKADPGPTARWGPVLTWDEGLALPGGAQMQHLRACYESVAWWTLQPRPGAVFDHPEVLVKAADDGTALVWFPPGLAPDAPARMIGPDWLAGRYSAQWFDTRTGQRTDAGPLAAEGPELPLPGRPDKQDWMLILRP